MCMSMRGNPKCNYCLSVWPDTCWIKRKCHMFRNCLKEKWRGKRKNADRDVVVSYQALDSSPFLLASQLNQSQDRPTNHLSALNTTENTLWSTGVISRCHRGYCFERWLVRDFCPTQNVMFTTACCGLARQAVVLVMIASIESLSLRSEA